MISKTKMWEYLIVDNADINKLNELGVNGWELITIIYFYVNSDTKYYFKRQIR